MGLFGLLGIIVILLGTNSSPGIEFIQRLDDKFYDSIYVTQIDYRIQAIFIIIGIILIVYGIKRVAEK